MNKIVILDAKTLGDDVSLDCFKEFGELKIFSTTKQDDIIKNIGDANIIITNKVIIDKNVMDNTSIKLICISATGMNNVDLEYAKKKNIEVKNVAGYSTNSVTQVTFSLVLEFINKIPHYDAFVKDGKWINYDTFTYLGKPFFELHNKKWGIIGFGEIGKNVAKVANSFGCEVCYYSTSGKNNDNIYSNVTLEFLLKTCDIITIHAPLNQNTENLLNKDNLCFMKEGSILINVGRGGIVNEQDIVDEVESRDIYYGTDVLKVEPMQKDSPLTQIKSKEKYIITPHIAWGSIESRQKLIRLVKENIKQHIL